MDTAPSRQVHMQTRTDSRVPIHLGILGQGAVSSRTGPDGSSTGTVQPRRPNTVQDPALIGYVRKPGNPVRRDAP
ncbi:hypothetical protein GCM10027610_013320 [Dactylosporangium cerinum]